MRTSRQIEGVTEPAGGLLDAAPLSTPIVRSTTFAAATAEQHAALFAERRPTFYQRFGAPNERHLEALLSELEGAEAGAVFASGMAAVSTALLSQVPAGSHVVLAAAVFEQTERVFEWMAAKAAVRVSRVDARDLRRVEEALAPGASLLYLESPSNPQLHVPDLAGAARLARSRGVPLFVDATFASAVLCRPLELGASLVIHSLTKLVNGHSDAMGGAVLGDAATIEAIRRARELFGGVLDPQAAWLIERGLETLRLRAARVSETALGVARFLEAHPAVATVRYPFLPSHEGYAIALRQMSGGGPVLCFRPAGGLEAARALVARLRRIRLATSLGGVESVIELPYDLDWAPGASAASPELPWLRLSVGLEDEALLRADLEAALAALPEAAPPPITAAGRRGSRRR